MTELLQSKQRQKMLDDLTFVYGGQKSATIIKDIEQLIERFSRTIQPQSKSWVDEQDIMLITYGDSIKEEGKDPLVSLNEFLSKFANDGINAVHLLPFYPYSSDDGFSVIDYHEVNSELGDWEDIQHLSKRFDLMFDGVINHISKESEWFQEYLNGKEPYVNYFIEADPNADYSSVTRPRALPLLTKFETSRGSKYIWTTFSDDQIDLNYENEKLLLAILELLLTYVNNGARFLRLDAIGFLWKKLDTSCIHLEETHKIIQVMRDVLESAAPGTIIITETNVPHKDNVSYFGNGYNEAHLVYQFPLPPLTLHTFQTGNAKYLTEWANSLEPTSEHTTFFNFLASHDGIGVRPVEGILSSEEVEALAKNVENNGGFVSYKDNGDGTKSPYELNMNYLDAISDPEEDQSVNVSRFMAAQSILLAMIGVPGIYVHSLLGSRNDYQGVEQTGRYRSINREKLDRSKLEQDLSNPGTIRHDVFNNLMELIKIRKTQKAFHPNAKQEVLFLDDRLFAIKRSTNEGDEQILAIVNVTDEVVSCSINKGEAIMAKKQVTDLITGDSMDLDGTTILGLTIQPYQVMWLKV